MNKILPATLTLTLSLLPTCLMAETSTTAPSGYSKNADANNTAKNCEPSQYVFSWSLADDCLPKPRGGSSRGAPITLDTTASAQWNALQQPGLAKFERDRRAILAMAGGYRASFEFLETVGYATDYKPPAPYQSWGTEYVYVVEDRGDFISLQHIMVMFVAEKDGRISQPMVMKHWRQDWHYQDTQLLEYVGNNRWKLRQLDKTTVQGTWSQSVYQVDDSPRYASIGTWQHNNSFSAWQSANTWRPLPRREHTVRNDYQVLEGTNRHVILPNGWVQEEQNQKLQLPQKQGATTYVANELGNNRYQRVKNFDWRTGDTYWNKTGPFWAVVRQQWARLFAKHPDFTLKNDFNGKPLFVALFELAEQSEAGKLQNPDEMVATTLANYLDQAHR
jgi:hypothetical protein